MEYQLLKLRKNKGWNRVYALLLVIMLMGVFCIIVEFFQTYYVIKEQCTYQQKVYRKGKCQMVKVTLKDGSKIEVEQGATILEVAKK